MHVRDMPDATMWVEPFIEHQGERRRFWLRRPRNVGERLLIAAKGTPIPATSGDRIVILLDLRTAFGSGGHGTTEGCLAALERFVRAGDRVLDAGTGTGILAIAAHRLGAAHVTAVDIDRRACAETERNLALNGIARGVVVAEGPVRSVPGRYDVVVANLRTPVLAGIVQDLSDRMLPGGIAILSGILERELHPFLSRMERHGLEPLETRACRGWMTLVSRERPVT